MNRPHIIIGGGTGYIGTCLAQTLRYDGARTTTISRMPGPGRMSWQDLERCGLPEDTKAVINVAGQNILNFTQSWSPGFKQNVWNSRVGTTKALAKAVQATKASSFITISGVAYYKPSEKEYTEYDHCEPYDFLSELCKAWEDAAKLPKDCNTRQVTIRSGVVLGRYSGMIKQIFLPFWFGLGGRIGTGKQYMPWIHIHDLVELFNFAIYNKSATGILNGVAPQIITNEEFTKAFASALSRPAFFPVPSFAFNLLLNKERAKIVLEGQKVVPKRVQELCFEYQYPDIQSACNQFSSLVYLEGY